MSYHSVPTIAESQRIIAYAMLSLSAADRDIAMEDLNAIHHPKRLGAQNQHALSEHITSMATWLSSHKSDVNQDQDTEQLSRDDVENRDLLRSFLQSSCFSNRVRHQDAIQAAQRMTEHQENMRRLFGSQRLVQDRLTLEDLDADDMQCLETGYWQIIGTDVAGRVIVGIFPILLRYRTPNSFLKAMVYFYMSVVSSLDKRQDQGLVLVYYNTTPSEPEMDRDLVSAAYRLLQSLPIKICAHHVVLHPQIHVSTAVSFPLSISMSNPQDQLQLQRRARYVFHSGQSREEVKLKLRRYGITIDLPCNDDGSEIRLDAHRQWLHSRQTTERQLTQRSEAASYCDNAMIPTSVSSGPSSLSSRSSSTHDTDTKSSSYEITRQLHRGIQRRSLVLDDFTGTMMKPSAKELLDRQLASDAHTHTSIETPSSGLEDLKPSAVAKFDSASILLSFDDIDFPEAFTSTASVTAKRQQMDPAMLVDVSMIRDTDILFGRGSGIQNHPGNIRFREILEQHLGSYNISDDIAKRNLVTRLANHMRKDLGMRFLKQTPDEVLWTTVTEKKVVQQKFYQTFRSLRAAAKRK